MGSDKDKTVSLHDSVGKVNVGMFDVLLPTLLVWLGVDDHNQHYKQIIPTIESAPV